MKKASIDDLKVMKARGEIADPAEGAEELNLPDGFWDDAVLQEPRAKKPISMRVDPDILEFFKAQGEGHLTRMHAVLRAYVDARQRAQSARNS
ncbi:MAG: BrnA antitoxin family protein [Sulfitobacter sp.]|nr:BrnA antitoxin family protein [Sulfitobacter sp.]